MSKFHDYFQIAGMAFFLFVFVGRTLYLRFRKNINAVTLGAGKKGLQRLIELSFFVWLALWIMEVFSYSLHIEFRGLPSFLNMRLIDALPVKLIGVILVVAGFAIFILALIAFGDSWRVGIDKKNPGDLVTTGIFSKSRNPIFVFLDLYFFGTFMINGTLVFLLFAMLVIVGLHYQMNQEENALVKIHGQAYKDYCAGTGRYFTWRRISHNN